MYIGRSFWGEHMSNYVLSCCSTADLTEEQFKKMDISFTCFTFELDGKQYKDDLGKSFPFDKFYEKVGAGAEVKTSQVNEEQYEEYFEKFLKDGNDVLHICFSSGLSGAINSAYTAKGVLSEKYPDRKIFIVDSLAASSGYGLFMDILSNMKKEGKTIEELYDFAEKNKLKINHWFFTSDLTCFIRGGRVSKTAGFVGKLLNICPLLNVNNEGKLIPREKIRGKKAAIDAMLNKMIENAEGGLDYNGKCYISCSACFNDAKELASKIEEKFKKLNGEVTINSIGTVIGCHTGPGTVALFFVGKERKN